VDPRSRAAIEASEKYADGTITNKELNTIERKAASAREKAVRTGEEELYNAAEAARQLASQFVDEMEAAYYALGASLASEADIAAGSSLLRDIFGNPFRPVSVDPAWLQWKDGTVPKLAQAIYNDRRFQDLPIVADALEKAGCTNQDILQHYRQSGEHVRGCWVVDVILGKK